MYIKVLLVNIFFNLQINHIDKYDLWNLLFYFILLNSDIEHIQQSILILIGAFVFAI